MDTFFEQIISIKKDGKAIAMFVAIWLAALVLCTLAFLMISRLGAIFVLLIAGIIYGAYRLSSTLNVEYEYIITNGVFDVDKIINKSSRKRVMSLEIATVSRLEKFEPALLNNIDIKDVVLACELKDENAYFLACQREGRKANYLIFSPNDKMKKAILKFLPKFIANSAFK